MDSATLIQTLANSVVASSIYALVAVGLALAFGVMKMANFAHGEFFMVGAYCVYVLYGLIGLPFPLAVVLAIPIAALLGLLAERFIFRPTRRNVLAGFMATAGLAFILQVVAGRIWGVGMAKSVPTPYMGTAEIGDANLGWQRLIVIPCAFAMLIALRYFLYHAKLGKALRACAQDPETAALQGIKINRMTALAMALAGASAGLAGALMAPIHAVTPYMGHGVVLIAFIVVIVGGMASIEGAILAAIILGFIHTFVTTLADNLIATMVGVAFMAVTLILRPKGLLGRERA
jgi:branched-chain amino acid transport system permease protein